MKYSSLLAVFSVFFLSCASPNHIIVFPRKMIVRDPVADVRSNQTIRSSKYEYDEDQETQVVRGESVMVYERQGKWARVECPEQLEFTHNDGWQGYPGWVLWKSLSSNLTEENRPQKRDHPEEDLRKKIMQEALRHIDSPYLWGGRSLFDPSNHHVLTGVDCSGLVNWSFRQAGILIPRDAHEQYMKSRRVEPADLKPGDLLFLAKKDQPEKIVHVAFISGKGRLLEGPQSGLKVRDISFKERFGRELSEMENGMALDDRVVYFGTLLTGE